jgi:hypothetical protein
MLLWTLQQGNKQFSPDQEGYITKDELERWLKWRVFPETRVNAEELIGALGLNSYNRWAIVGKTHGVMADDEIWLRFKGETLNHRDVTLRENLFIIQMISIIALNSFIECIF